MPLGRSDMEWSMLLVAAVLATAAVTTVHVLRRHPHAAATGHGTTTVGLDRQVAEDRAVRAVEADVEAAHEAAEHLSVEQHRRG